MQFILKTLRSITLALGVLCALSASAYGQGFDLEFDFGTEFSEFSPSQLSVFDQVESTFESQIFGYQTGVSLSGAVIDVSAEFIDGSGGTAGEGGGSFNGIPNGGFQFFVPTTNPSFIGTDGLASSASGTFSTGVLELDEDDLATLESFDDGLFNIIYHEVAHALGFGALWEANGLVDSAGQYTGINGLTTYQNEFDASALTVPTDGTNISNAGHWNENSLLGTDLLSPVLVLGGNNPISDTTIATFNDLGFITSVPEPSSVALLATSGLLLLRRKRRAA